MALLIYIQCIHLGLFAFGKGNQNQRLFKCMFLSWSHKYCIQRLNTLRCLWGGAITSSRSYLPQWPSGVLNWWCSCLIDLVSLSVTFCGPCFILLFTEWLRLTFPVKEKTLLPSGNKRVSRSSCPKPESQTPVSFPWIASQTLWEWQSPHWGQPRVLCF